jgi:TAG lipase/steryl ester hydrolase/phospholipase A2/LPA acyltransferase
MYGQILDVIQGKEKWKNTKESSLYDWERIENKLEHMRNLREAKDIQGLIHCLRQDLQKNLGGICNPILYNITKVGTKKLIEDYHNETIKCIQFIYYYQGSKINLQNKLEFFTETRHSLGKTAIFLSGGAGFGKYHIGVMKALWENDLMPRTIAGSSVGALIAAGFASHKYSDIWKCFDADYGMMCGDFLGWKFKNYYEAI